MRCPSLRQRIPMTSSHSSPNSPPLPLLLSRTSFHTYLLCIQHTTYHTTVIHMMISLKAIAVLPLLAAGGATAFSLSMSSALIVQNKGGGHGELGFQLAKNLQSNPKITSITILQDKACNDSKEPFASYATDIPNVEVIKADLADETMTAADMQALLKQQSFDYVWDNASKGAVGAGKAVIDSAKEWDSKLLTYVSSAGIYQPNDIFPMPETTPVKESAGQVQYEKYGK